MFTHPSFLWWLPLAILPVLLHLLFRRRVQTVELSTFRFLFEGSARQRRQSRWLERLVLLLRVVFLLLLVLALSRPRAMSITQLLGDEGSRAVVIIFDANRAMQLRSGGQSSLERGKVAAKAVINKLSATDHLSIIVAGPSPVIMHRDTLATSDAALAAIDAIKPVAARGNLLAAIEQALVQGGEASPRIFIISDGRALVWQAIVDEVAAKGWNSKASLSLLNVGGTERAVNVGLIGDAVATDRAVVGLPVSLGVTIRGSANKAGKQGETESRTLAVMLDDRKVHELNVTVPMGGQVTRSITVTPTVAGPVHGRFVLSNDSLEADDVFHFALNVAPRLQVLAVIASPAGRNITSQDQPLIYLQAALKQASREQASGEAALGGDSMPVNLNAIAHDELTDAQLKSADVVVLADAPIDRTRAGMLRRYVEQGGGLLVLPGTALTPSVINDDLLAGIASNGSSAVQYGQPHGDVNDESTFMTIGQVGTSHPVMSVFAAASASETSLQYFESIRLYRFHPIQIDPSLAPDSGSGVRPRILLSLIDGSPVLVEMDTGRGRIMLAGFAATPDGSNLPLTGSVFVPLLVRSLEHLRRSSPVIHSNAVQAGAVLDVAITDAMSDAQLQVTDGRGQLHQIMLHRSDTQRVGRFEGTHHPGFYTLDATTPAIAENRGGTAIRQGVAVNADAGQSDITTFDDQALSSLIGQMNGIYIRSSAEDPQLLAAMEHRGEIWRLLIAVLFVLMGLEMALSTRRS